MIDQRETCFQKKLCLKLSGSDLATIAGPELRFIDSCSASFENFVRAWLPLLPGVIGRKLCIPI
jgi:hypothetical protein